MRLERLVYRSTATGTTGSIANLAPILAESHRNNHRDGLTGALAAHRDIYLQVLEGAPSALDNLLRRLAEDPRHKDLVILARDPVADREFDRWTMANARITPELEPLLDAVMDGAEALPAGIVTALREGLADGQGV